MNELKQVNLVTKEENNVQNNCMKKLRLLPFKKKGRVI